MRSNHSALTFILTLAASAAHAQVGAATGTLAQRIGHYDPSLMTRRPGGHNGPGTMEVGNILQGSARGGSLSTNFMMLQVGLINPRGGIAEHFHNDCEEMFIILEGPAPEFTVNGRTSAIPTPSGVSVRMGSSHAIYNPSPDKPILWMNVNVSMNRVYDAYNLEDGRVSATLDRIPQFVNFRMDSRLLKPVVNMGGGTGSVLYRRLLGPTVFSTPWSYVDEISIPSGASIGPINEPDMSEAWYVISGAGTVTVNGEKVNIKKGDAIPVDLGESHSFTQTGSEPLHMVVNGIARDLATKRAYIDKPGTLGAGWPARN
jgi:mannose-6-phosphate isomerase-like protein (cupin superfamily)